MYTFPASGGLNLTINGIEYGVWQDTNLLGDALIAGHLDPTNGWTSLWTSTFQDADTWQAQVTAAGGIMSLLETFVVQINEAFAAFIATLNPVSPVAPTTPYSIAAVNQALAQGFTLTDVNGVPTVGLGAPAT